MVHVQRCFLGKELGVEGVDGQESVAELRVLDPPVLVLVVPLQEVLHVLPVSEDIERLQTAPNFIRTDPALALLVKDAESIYQVEISAKGQVDLGLFKASLELKLPSEDVDDALLSLSGVSSQSI